MESIPTEIASWLLNNGPFAGFSLILMSFYMWERKGRADDRKEFDAQLKQPAAFSENAVRK